MASRTVIDTNVFVSAAMLSTSVPGRALQRALDESTLLLSDETLLELVEVLGRKKFHRYTTSTYRNEFVAQLYRDCTFVETSSKLTLCRDPKDNHLLNLAVDGDANFLMTGDQDLLVMDRFRGIRILTPAMYLGALLTSR